MSKMGKLAIDMDYVLSLTEELIAIPSVAGDCREILVRLEKEFARFGLNTQRTNKGALFAPMDGDDISVPACMVGAHADTLGLIVREIKENGRLRVFQIGGYNWENFLSENVWIRTAEGKMIRGTLLADKASRHAFGLECDMVHDENSVEVRIDEDTSSAAETRGLGIEVGDFVFYDTKYELRPNGYIKSHFLDDKVCVAAMFGAIKAMTESGVRPTRRVWFNISNYEEVANGLSYIPQDVSECMSLDIGIVAPRNNSSEKCVTIVARDSRTPYDFEFRNRLVSLSKRDNIPYRVDVNFRYGSDASVAVLAGKDFNFTCIGPGVDASHNYERTHVEGVKATADLIVSYITDPVKDHFREY